VSFIEAIEILARETGMQMPARDPEAQQKADRRSQLIEVMEQAVQFYRLQLKTTQAAAARDYLDGRGLPQAAQDRWEIGFAPPGWQNLWDHLRGKNVAEDLILDAGLAKGLPERLAKCRTGDESYSYCSAGYLELSGTSMAAPLVSAAAAMMLDKDSSLSPATVKARLMRSARKINGDILAVGAGVLDVDAAMNATGRIYGDALSPIMTRSDEGPVLLMEDTAKLWGDDMWGSAYLWTHGYLWTDGYNWTNGYLWSDAYLWSESYLWTNAYLWTFSYLWTDAYLWAKAYLWTDAVTNYNSLYELSDTSIELDDD